MESVLFVAFCEPDDSLSRASLEAFGAAAVLADALGASLTAGLIGTRVEAAAAQVAHPGARRLGVQGEAFGVSRYATDAAAAEALARASGATLVLAAGTARANRCLPGVAQRLGGAIETHATRVECEGEAVTVTRWYYRQRIEATLARADRPWIVLLEPGAEEPWSAAPSAAAPAVELLPLEVSPGWLRTRVTGVQAPPAALQTIRPDADLLLVAGAGWTKKQSDGQIHASDAESLIRGFLDCTRASLGGSKSLVDMSGEGHAVLPFMTHLNQIGQTGSTPRHRKGLATCCHGEEPHVVGWRFVTERRAVNLNASCGWAQGKADVLYVADAFAVVAEVNRLLASTASDA
jgi:electron transfer flavoprotein alpha subunit